MKILALANLDGEPVPRAALRDVAAASGVSAIAFAGNVLPPRSVPAREAQRLYTRFFETLAALGVPVAVVPGAYDTHARLLHQAIRASGQSAPLVAVDRTVASLGDVLVGGLGGLVGDETNAEAKEIAAQGRALRQAHLALAPLARQEHDGLWLLLVHTPPCGTVVDRHDGRHVGRRAINWLIANVRATVTICGFARDGQGKDEIDGALVVNPGPLAQGRYAVIDLDLGIVRFGILPQPGRRGPQPGRRGPQPGQTDATRVPERERDGRQPLAVMDVA